MSWPTMTDYQEAIQNPQFCFSDPELRNGAPVLNMLGLPKPITGAFASVYQINTGAQRYAVRCFLRYYPDQQQRYAAIGSYLEQVQLPYTVDFRLLQQGIRIRGQWYPILKMEWLDGLPLNIVIEQSLGSPGRLQELTDSFLRMVADLRRNTIAHGDLQHGNIMVVDGELKLIDYDGMYVPSLHGMFSHELGHRNYQHPGRTERDFGPHIDNFSTWVIYLSLLAVSAKPGLWNQFKAGDECLLFRQNDFTNFGASDIARALYQINDPNVQALLESFRNLTGRQIAQVPSILRNSDVPTPPRQKIAAPAPGKNWLDDYVGSKTRVGKPGSLPEMAEESSGADWIWDYVDGPPPETKPSISLSSDATTPATPAAVNERYVIGAAALGGYAALVALVMGILAPSVAGSILGGTFLVTVSFLGIQYAGFPEVQYKRRLTLNRLRLRWQIARSQRQLERMDTHLDSLAVEEQQAIEELDRSLDQYMEQELADRPIKRREVPGITSYVERQLHAAGIHSAGDVTYPVVLAVEGVDHRLAVSLVRWREKVEAQLRAEQLRPILLWQTTQKATVRRDFQAQRQALMDEIVAEKQRLFQKESELMVVQHELSNYLDVTFGAYLKWIF